MRDDTTTAGNDVPALRRGLALLRAVAVAAGDGATMAELAQTVPVSRATGYRLLRALMEEGFVANVPEAAGRYVLGPAVDALRGARAPARTVEEVASPIMASLAATVDETVKLVVRDGVEALTLSVSIPSRDSCLAARVGTRLPLHVGASQRLLLAHAPDAVREAVFAGKLARFTPRTIVSAAHLRRETERLTGRRAFASHDEGIDGVGAAAALVGDGERAETALVAVYVHESRGATQRRAILREVTKAASQLTAALASARMR